MSTNKLLVILMTSLLLAARVFAQDQKANVREQQLSEAEKSYQSGMKLLKQGKYHEAMEMAQKSLSIRRHFLSDKDPVLAQSLNLLSGLYGEMGLYEKSLPLLQETLKIRELHFGPNHALTAISMANLAEYYRRIGDFEKSEILLNTALRIYDKVADKNLVHLVTMTNNLGSISLDIENYEQAEVFFKRALQIMQANPPADPITLSRTLTGLGLVHENCGAYEKAEQYYQQALITVRRSVGDQHPYTATILNNLAEMYETRQQYAKAYEFQKMVLKIADVQKNAPLQVVSLNNIGSNYHLRGLYKGAEAFFKKALHISKNSLSSENPLFSRLNANMAMLYFVEHKIHDSLPYFYRHAESQEAHFRNESLLLPEIRIARLIANFQRNSDLIYTAILQNKNSPDLTKLALASLLLQKGRLATESTQISQSLHSDPSPQVQEKFEVLRSIRSRFSSLSLSGRGAMAPERYHSLLQALNAQADELEEDLAGHSTPLRVHRQLPGVREIVDRVADQLAADAALVEIVAFHHYDPTLPVALQRNELRYLALVLTPDHRVAAVDLGQGAPLDMSAERLHQALADPRSSYLPLAQELFNRLITPLLPHLGVTRHLYISPDGPLLQIPFDILHDGQAFLCDRYRISSVTSGRDLLPRDVIGAPHTSVIVLADPDFGARRSEPAGKVRAESSTRNRGFRLDGLVPLPGTRKEAMTIKSLLPQAQLLLGKEATESALLGVTAPGILHVATHGLFVAENEPSPSQLHRSFELDSGPAPGHPLLRSALALAGASVFTPTNSYAIPELPDGLVTALELSGMNLWGTQLVVLSACDSGLGQVKLGQGIYGLRRAIITAGAETLVTSLWKVDDEVTQELMSNYYRLLLDGAGRTEAMRRAAEMLRSRYPHPYYWASFIVIGQGGPLRGVFK